MQICIFTEPHRGASYDTQRTFARQVEDCGFEGLFRADHLQPFGSSDGLPGPTDAWITLAGLAVETSRIRLGTLVTSITFRWPGMLAISVAQVDQMSNGRVELGIGAGWYEREHQAYGIPFPPLPQRLDQLAEQIEVITGLWRAPVGESFSYAGEHYQLSDAPALPKPVQQPGPPIIIGGRGPKRTPELAARYATEFNATFPSVAETTLRFSRVREALQRVERDPALPPLRLSSGIPVACGRTDVEIKARMETLHEPDSALPPGEDPVAGPPDQLAERIEQLREAGAERVYLRLSDQSDLAHLELIATDVLPQLSR